MTSTAAVAAAIRQRLIEGRPAPLRGLGALVRQHVASRIEERPDGSRVLLPPGETIGLAAERDGQASLAPAFARFRGVADADAEAAYASAMDQIEARLAATGEVRLPGVGLLRRTSGGIVLGVEAELLQAVNQTYEGLAPVAAPAPPSPAPTPAPPAVSPPVEVVPPSEPPSLDPAPEGPDAPPPEPLPSTAPPPPLAPVSPPISPSAASFADEMPFPEATPDEVADAGPADDDDLLDEVMDDAMPAPFGDPSGPPLADRLPPTPPRRQPPPDAPASAPSSPVDDWAEETWTAPAFDDAPLRSDDGFGADPDPFEDPVEDADFDVVPPVTPPMPAPPAAAPPPPLPDDDGPDVVLAPILGGEPGVAMDGPEDAPLAAPEPPAAAPQVAATEPPEDTSDRSAGWLWALFVVLLVAALAATATWFWPEIEPILFPDAPQEQATPGEEETLTIRGAGAAPADGAAPQSTSAPAVDAATPAVATSALPAGSGAVQRTTAGGGQAAPTAETPPPGADRRALAPPSDQAILPPVLAGLGTADRAALSGRAPIDPEAAAWTLVVLSTASRADAQALVDRYRQAGYRASVLASTTMFRVAIGQFPSRADALRLRDRLPPQAPPDTWILDLQTL